MAWLTSAWRPLVAMVELSLRADTPRSIGAVLAAIGQSATLPFRAIGLAVLTDGVLTGNMQAALGGAALMLGLSTLNRLSAWASLTIRMRMRENTQLYVDAHLMQLTADIPGLEHHERPEYLDRMERIQTERWSLANPFNPISWTIASIVQVVGVSVMLASVHPLLLLLPLSGVPGVVASLISQRAWIGLEDAHAESHRLLRHLVDLTIEQAAAKEIRVYGLVSALTERRRNVGERLKGERARLLVRSTAGTAAANLVFAVGFIGALAFTIDLAFGGEVTPGGVVLVLSLSTQMNVYLEALVFNLAWLVRTHGAVTKLVWLRDYAAHASRRAAISSPKVPPPTLQDGIAYENVSFRYPGTERPVLEAVDLHLPAGSTVAIVGENGAGKTTLVKLLSRFYEPTSGRIRVDGVDLEDIGIEEWRKRLAAGFQDFARLQLLARESIGTGDLQHLDDDPYIDRALVRAAASDLPTVLPRSLETRLGRYFEGGVDLSLGQWQKVALTRAMMREQILLLLLDEPTASLDAPTEHALFEHFAQAARDYAASSGAITVLVSHRFSTVRMADQIVVIADGRIAERGTHQELIERDGLYAELYGLQAAAYR